jgi:hypothetical protein
MDALPFTTEQFLETFAVYNRSTWPFVLGWWLLSLSAVLAAWRARSVSPRLMQLLALLWAWNALVYHAWLFSPINPAAWAFAAAFLAEAALLASSAQRLPSPFFTAGGWRQRAGIGLTGYAFAYPLLTMVMGHSYPGTPTFGVPCPTVILTIGLLLTMRHMPVSLSFVPVLWGFIGGSAAIFLSISTDYVLLAAGTLLTTVALTRVVSAG